MSTPNISANSQPNTLTRRAVRPPAFKNNVDIVLAMDHPPVTSSAYRGHWEPPSSTVWNCDLHDRFVRCDRF
jgi:hypothetical protein